MDDLNLNLRMRDILKGILNRFDRAWHIAFNDNVQLFYLAFLDLDIELIKGKLFCFCVFREIAVSGVLSWRSGEARFSGHQPR